jgi:hypothetical protein
MQRAERATANSLLVAELVHLMADVPELDAERWLLEATPDRSALRVPPGTATGTTSWSVYEAAVRAACFWWPEHPRPSDHGSLAAQTDSAPN